MYIYSYKTRLDEMDMKGCKTISISDFRPISLTSLSPRFPRDARLGFAFPVSEFQPYQNLFAPAGLDPSIPSIYLLQPQDELRWSWRKCRKHQANSVSVRCAAKLSGNTLTSSAYRPERGSFPLDHEGTLLFCGSLVQALSSFSC